MSIAARVADLNRSNRKRRVLECNTILTLCLELLDALPSERVFYLRDIYESALMSENRKMIEALQARVNNMVEFTVSTDQMPMPVEDIKFAEVKALQEINNEMKDNLHKDTQVKAGLEFYYEVQANTAQLFEQKRNENEELSKNLCHELIDEMISAIAPVEELTDENLRNPQLMENLEEHISNLLVKYSEDARGPQKGILFLRRPSVDGFFPSFLTEIQP